MLILGHVLLLSCRLCRRQEGLGLQFCHLADAACLFSLTESCLTYNKLSIFNAYSLIHFVTVLRTELCPLLLHVLESFFFSITVYHRILSIAP